MNANIATAAYISINSKFTPLRITLFCICCYNSNFLTLQSEETQYNRLSHADANGHLLCCNFPLTMKIKPSAPLLIWHPCMAFCLAYFLCLLAWKLFGGKLQAAVRKARALWTSALHHHSIKGEGLEVFDRDLDANDANSYPPLLGESRNHT